MKRRRSPLESPSPAGTPTGGPAGRRADPGSPEDEPRTPPYSFALQSGVSGLWHQVLAVASLAAGGVLLVIARGSPLDGELIGVALAGLLLVAPLPMFAGDAADAVLVLAVRHRWLSIDGYHRYAALVILLAIAFVGIATYPIVVAIGGKGLFSIFVVAAAFVLFGVIPIGAWLSRKVRKAPPGV
ncbi:MAG: hypothetical protein HY263_03780 [Chloroflexi bacterium]|nr:hypothetical protein [Chloroflexota bacterium]